MIYLLRHGQTEFNAERRIQGRCDSPLTALGRAQARGFGELLADQLGPDNHIPIISSPLGRAVETAGIVREHSGLQSPLQTDARLQEIGCGSWEKRSRDMLAKALRMQRGGLLIGLNGRKGALLSLSPMVFSVYSYARNILGFLKVRRC